MKVHKCKYCGDIITPMNKYVNNVCSKSDCIKKHLKVCDDNCFKCIHHDCIITSTDLLKNEDYMNHLMRKNKSFIEGNENAI